VDADAERTAGEVRQGVRVGLPALEVEGHRQRLARVDSVRLDRRIRVGAEANGGDERRADRVAAGQVPVENETPGPFVIVAMPSSEPSSQ